MKKKICIPIVLTVLLFAVLFVPIPMGQMKDGGTKVYSALTYKIVKWNRLYDDGRFTADRVYFGADAYKSVDELFAIEEENIENVVLGTFLRFEDSFAIIIPLSSEWEYTNYADLGYIKFDISDLSVIGVNKGDIVKVTYKVGITESSPGVINAVDWSLAKLTRYSAYEGKWLDDKTAQAYDVKFSDLRITEIYSNCFFAESLIGESGIIKLNGSLSDEWCVSDVILCTYENAKIDANGRIECDYLTIEESNFWENTLDAKPVIYLYPEDITSVSVELDYKGLLTCTYPKYTDGWNVTAQPDGTLTDENGKEYNYLYWEGITDTEYDFSEGFCIRGEDTAEFLEYALEKLGLTRREANEFIVYWLPLMESNVYNVISFQEESYTDIATLDIAPAPDTLIRVFMAWYASDVYINIPEAELTGPVRDGFTAVEWGGTQIKK